MKQTEYRILELEGKIIEPLLNDDEESRYVLFPLKHPKLFEFYKRHMSTFWTAEECDFAHDKKDFDTLNENEKHFIKTILGFFASSDMIVNENLCSNFLNEVKYVEAKFFYGWQQQNENIHSEVYSLLIETLCGDSSEKNKLFNAIKKIPCVAKKAKWALQWTDSRYASFAERLIAFAAVEGIFFSGSFCAIFWLKKRGLMPGLTFSNELISRDEGLHCDFACYLYSLLNNKLPEKRVFEIIDGAVENEIIFITKALPVSLIGMNSNLMIEYIKFCADRLLNSLGYQKKYKAKNPFPWMTLISLDGKTNFFEKRVGEYSKAGVLEDEKDNFFTLTAEF